MAKNENKNANKPIEDMQPKVAGAESQPKTNAENKDLKNKLSAETEKSVTSKVENHGWRKFVLFIFLCLLGALAFFVLQTEQNKRQNAEMLQKLETAYEAKLNTAVARVNVLEREVAALKDRPIVEQVAGVSENLLNQKIAAVRDELEYRLAQITVAENKNESVIESTAKTKDESAKQSVAERKVLPETQIITLAAEEKKTQEVLLASGAIIVRDLAEQGVSFAYEAEVLQILARGNDLAENYVRTVRMFANVGVLGKTQLIRNFEKVFFELNTAQTKSEAQSTENMSAQKWYEQAWTWLKATVVVRKGQEKPVFSPEKDEVYELVHEGRFQDAVNAMKLSEKYAKVASKPLNEWYLQVSRYIQFNNAVSGLIMNALANIHLKEMEHAAQ